MRKFIYGLVRIFAISSLIFTSCDNFNGSNILEPICANNSESASTETSASKADRLSGQAEYVTLSGTFAPSGAYPEEVVQSFIEPAGGENSSRSAFPAVSTTDTSLTYTITAKCGSSFFPGNISDDKKSYTVSIPVQSEAMICTVEAKILSGDVTLFSGESESFTISSENPVVTVPELILKVLSSSGNGSIELEIDVAESGISYCIVKLDDNLIFDDDGGPKKFTVSSNKITVTKSDVDADAYSADFSFYSSNDELLYKFNDTGINVISGMKTNTWVQNGSESWFVTTGTGTSKTTTCRITKAIVDGFALDEIYVTDPASAPASLKTGSWFNPLTSFEDAIKKLNNSSKDYTIIIKGTLTGTQTIPDTLKKSGGTYNANSLTIMGDTADAKLDGAFTEAGTDNTVLNIKTAVPVTIKKLTITGGYCKGKGGGINIETGAEVTLGDGTPEGAVSITENKGTSGFGVYCNQSTLTVKKYVTITQNEYSTDDYALYGGGIYLNGINSYNKNCILYMEGGEISSNANVEKSGRGGGIYSRYGTVYIYGEAVIKNNGNSKYSGGGIFSEGSYVYLGYKNKEPLTEAEWTGSINHNTAKEGGGVYSQTSAGIYMKSGSINNNSAVSGGGIYIDYGCFAFLYDNFNIKDNTASENGGAVYCYSYAGSRSYLHMDGGAFIPAGADGKQDVYLKNDAETEYITIDSQLTAEAPVAKITPSTYESGKQILAENTTGLLASEYQKFAITPKTGDSGTWTIDSEGKLGVSYSVSAENLASVITGLPASDSVLKVVCTGGEVDYAALKSALTNTNASKVSLDISNVSNTSLGNNTFSDCTKLYEIYLGTTSDTDFGYGVFLNCTNLAYIHLYKMESFKDSTFADYRNTDVKLVLCPEGKTVAVNAYCTPDSTIPDNWYLVDYECKAADREFTPAQFYKNGTIYKWVPVRE